MVFGYLHWLIESQWWVDTNRKGKKMKIQFVGLVADPKDDKLFLTLPIEINHTDGDLNLNWDLIYKEAIAKLGPIVNAYDPQSYLIGIARLNAHNIKEGVTRIVTVQRQYNYKVLGSLHGLSMSEVNH